MNEGMPSKLGTSTISDALDRVGVEGQALGIVPLAAGMAVCGRAFTVRFTSTTGRGGTVGDFIDHVDPQAVVVLDNGGRLDVTVWGDLLTAKATEQGLAGTVIHGVCRDSSRIVEQGYPLFSRGVFMRTGKDRVRAEAYQEIVSLGSASVAPGDVVVGDSDGVVVVPREHESRIFELAYTVHVAEEQIRAAINAGVPLNEAREISGYHNLQQRET